MRYLQIDEIIKIVKENYPKIQSDLKKFDMFKRSKAKKAPFIPTYMQKGNKFIMIVNKQEHRSYCSDISGLIQLYLLENHNVKSKVMYGKYVGSGKTFSHAKWDAHAWVELDDGTIIDGSFIQFQSEKKEDPILLKIVRPDDPLHKSFKKSEWQEPELEPLPYIIEARNRKYSELQAIKENKYWRRK